MPCSAATLQYKKDSTYPHGKQDHLMLAVRQHVQERFAAPTIGTVRYNGAAQPARIATVRNGHCDGKQSPRAKRLRWFSRVSSPHTPLLSTHLPISLPFTAFSSNTLLRLQFSQPAIMPRVRNPAASPVRGLAGRKRPRESSVLSNPSCRRCLNDTMPAPFFREGSPSKSVHFPRTLTKGRTPSGPDHRSQSPTRPALHRRTGNDGTRSPSAQLHAEEIAAHLSPPSSGTSSDSTYDIGATDFTG